MFTRLRSRVGITAIVSISGPSARSGCDEGVAVARVADDRRLDEDERSRPQVVGQERHVGELEHPAERLARLRHGHRSTPARRAGSRPRARSARTGRPRRSPASGQELHLERGHGAHVAAAAAQRPQQLGLRLAVGPHDPAVGEDDVRRDDRVAGEPVRASHPADPAAERIADDADVGRCAGEVGEAVLAGGVGEVAGEDARLEAGASGSRVDRDRPHPLRLEQDRVVGPGDRTRVVTAGVERDPVRACGGVADGQRPRPSADTG